MVNIIINYILICHIFICLFIYLFMFSFEKSETSVDFYLHSVTLRFIILPTIAIPWKRRQNGKPLSKQAISSRPITVRILNTTEKLNVKTCQDTSEFLCDVSWYKNNYGNAFGISDNYSYKTKIIVGKYASIYATKRQFFPNPIHKFGFEIFWWTDVKDPIMGHL
jgi:hypothetical protein